MKQNKVWHAGKVRQEELDEIDACRLCEIIPELEKTCYATEYCHRQMKMQLEESGNDSRDHKDGEHVAGKAEK